MVFLQTFPHYILSQLDLQTPGPSLAVQAGGVISIVDRGVILCEGVMNWEDAILCLLACYYLLDISFPRAYGLLMGLFQVCVIREACSVSSKSLSNLLSQLSV
jgi:hypothetical protein